MTLHKSYLKGETVFFTFSIGNCVIDVTMPKSNLTGNGDLHTQVEEWMEKVWKWEEGR